jgi:hypothetical protein
MHYIYTAIIYVSTPTCSDAATSASVGLHLVFPEVRKLLKLLWIKIIKVIILIVL